jgi:hypothetical protein
MGRKKSKGGHIPSMVANFVMGLIGKCRHKQISLDPHRYRTKLIEYDAFPKL